MNEKAFTINYSDSHCFTKRDMAEDSYRGSIRIMITNTVRILYTSISMIILLETNCFSL